ncbi:cell division protein ZapA [Alteribacillus iranensis]|uniref:Cell division protein ZapA n=1 Tax=Alteribacillus iranensis TaxID=930128 RepID=A0A1I2CL68_9BACI|nr:cell division protein ZapA [Alteribacillus iranensis]SFE69056.1 cell division protein ZapA [Alteribacillus iranensis]
MDEEKNINRTTVSIYGQQYTIKGESPSEHVKVVSEYVDSKMREIKKKNPYLDTTKLAVLTALNTADEYITLREKLKEDESNKRDGER